MGRPFLFERIKLISIYLFLVRCNGAALCRSSEQNFILRAIKKRTLFKARFFMGLPKTSRFIRKAILIILVLT